MTTITKEEIEYYANGEHDTDARRMARMLLAAQRHITELEMAPPPLEPGEEPMPVMPDFPGRIMTQRECFQAGKEVGLASAALLGRKEFEAWWEAWAEQKPFSGWENIRTEEGYCDEEIDLQYESWNACRAAMLKGGE